MKFYRVWTNDYRGGFLRYVKSNTAVSAIRKAVKEQYGQRIPDYDGIVQFSAESLTPEEYYKCVKDIEWLHLRPQCVTL